eukprot:m.276224 g.276224  ORF g.276224 m.276224 type:complete len:579 (+) comp15711_c0_seq2:143-1879(+)
MYLAVLLCVGISCLAVTAEPVTPDPPNSTVDMNSTATPSTADTKLLAGEVCLTAYSSKLELGAEVCALLEVLDDCVQGLSASAELVAPYVLFYETEVNRTGCLDVEPQLEVIDGSLVFTTANSANADMVVNLGQEVVFSARSVLGELGDIHGELEGHQSDLQGLNEALAATNRYVAAVQATGDSLESRLMDAEASIEANDEAIASLDTQTSGQISTAFSKINDIISDPTVVRDDELATKLASLETQMLSSLTAEMSTLMRTVGSLIGTLSAQSSSLQAQANTMASVLASTSTLTGSVSTVASQAKAKADSADEVDVRDGSTDGKSCTTAESGQIYFSTSTKDLYFCNSAIWTTVTLKLGTEANPAISCQAIYEAGHSTGNGNYFLKYSDGSSYRQECLMDEYDGGWTLFYDLGDGTGADALKNQPCNVEKTDLGPWRFSMSAMAASTKQLLIKESVAPYRAHYYRFDASSACRDNFLITVTGDYRSCNPLIYNWSTGGWVQTQSGTCNNNNHSQWNCTPSVGLRFHYSTRNCVNDGGSGPYPGYEWFTGYEGGWFNPGGIVKNWNGAYNKTPHKLYFR